MSAPLHRCLAVWLIATAAAAGLIGGLLPVALAPATRFDEVLVRVCAAAGTIAAGWLWLATTAVTIEARRGRTRIPVPAPLRRALLAACGVALVAGLAAPAGAATPQRQPQHASAIVAEALAALPLPDRAHGGPGPRRTSTPATPAAPTTQSGAPDEPRAASDTVTVRPGDTLWGLAMEHLGSGRRWAEIYALNRAAIGADPDLIRPALRLRIPAPSAPSAPKESR